MTPGMTKMNTGSTFRKPPKMVPRRASSSLAADSTRWTMNWSVHQYQTPRIGAPKRMPVHGKSGSDIGFHMSKKLEPAVALSSPQPPSCPRPIKVTATAPPTSTNICTMSV